MKTIDRYELAKRAQQKVPQDSCWKLIRHVLGKKYIAICSCGSEKEVWVDNIINGKSKKCNDCRSIEKLHSNPSKTHGLSKERLYRKYKGMKSRCYNKNSTSYCRYGAKGIVICDEWLSDYVSFRNFAISNGYKEGLEIDRIDPKGNYEPSNCRFITKSENSSRANIGSKQSFERRELAILARLKITKEEIDDIIECALSGLFKCHELSTATNINQISLNRLVKRYGFTPSWSRKRQYVREQIQSNTAPF